MFDQKKILDHAVAIARQAGTILLEHYAGTLTEHVKPHAGIVTQADVASETFLKTELHALLPQAGVWAEESGQQPGAHEYWWVIDPLDGTTNFYHKIPHWCISIALVCNDKAQLAVVYAPIANLLFTAIAGQKAWCNGVRLPHANQSSGTDGSAAAETRLVGISCPYVCAHNFCDCMGLALPLRQRAIGVRVLGSAALDLAFVAAGTLSGCALHGLGWWDVAAGMLLVQESGARITQWDGSAVGPAYTSLVAGRGAMYDTLAALCGEFSG